MHTTHERHGRGRSRSNGAGDARSRPRGHGAAVLAMALASACARSTPPAAPAAAPEPAAPEAEPAPLDEGACVALVVTDENARRRCEDGDDRGPCVSEVSVERWEPEGNLHVCLVLAIERDFETMDTGDESETLVPISESGAYTLAVIDRADGDWIVRDHKEYTHWSQEIEQTRASIETDEVGPGRRALIVVEQDSFGAYGPTERTFYLVSSRGLTEIFAYTSVQNDSDHDRREHGYDDSVTTAGFYDIVISVEQEEYYDVDEDGEEDQSSFTERYRWDGSKYARVEEAPRE